MPNPKIAGMPLSDFFKRRTRYEQAAKDRVPERLEHQSMDTPHPIQVLEEIVMDLLIRSERLEEQVVELRALLGQE